MNSSGYFQLLRGMETRYQVLKTIYEIAKQDSNPLIYPCRPREIILRLFFDWEVIQKSIEELEQEKLVTTKQLDTLVVFITAAGIEKTKAQQIEAEK